MTESQVYIPIQPLDLPGAAAERLAHGWRLALITAVADPQGLEITYSFEHSQGLEHLRLRPDKTDGGFRVPSICAAYGAAFTYENELQDLFGVKVDGLFPDYAQHFYTLPKGDGRG